MNNQDHDRETVDDQTCNISERDNIDRDTSEPIYLHLTTSKPVCQSTLLKIYNNVTNNDSKMSQDTQFTISTSIIALE